MRALSALEGLDQGIRTFQQRAVEARALAGRNYVLEIQRRRLQAIPIDELKRHAPGARLQALKDFRLTTLADMQNRSANSLIQIRGIGPDSAMRIAAAVATVTELSNRQPIPVPWPGSEHGAERPLLEAICHLGRAESWFADPKGRMPVLIREFRDRAAEVRRGTSFGRWLTSLGKHPDLAVA
jgi:hypothetical protein